MSIGLKIKQLLASKKSNAPELAKAIGKTKQSVYGYLEKNDIDTAILRNIANFFNVPISYFFDEDPEQGNGFRVGDVLHNNNNTVVINGEATTIAGLIEKVKGLKRECELLREMNEMLKNRQDYITLNHELKELKRGLKASLEIQKVSKFLYLEKTLRIVQFEKEFEKQH